MGLSALRALGEVLQFGCRGPERVALALIVPAIGFVAYFVIKALQANRGVNVDLAYREIPPE